MPSVFILPDDVKDIIDKILVMEGRFCFQEFNMGPVSRLVADEVTRYVAQRARQLSSCEVRVKRVWDPSLGYLSVVRILPIRCGPPEDSHGSFG